MFLIPADKYQKKETATHSTANTATFHQKDIDAHGELLRVGVTGIIHSMTKITLAIS